MTGSQSAAGAQLLQRFRARAASFSRSRLFSADILVQFADVPVIVRVRDGRVTELVEHRVPLQSSDFSIKGSEEGWTKFWQAAPPAGWHDIFALNKRREFSIEGNLQPLMAHLQYVKDLLASPREASA
jgi:hypothetical protein